MSMRQAQKFMCVHAFVEIHEQSGKNSGNTSGNSCNITKYQEFGKDGLFFWAILV